MKESAINLSSLYSAMVEGKELEEIISDLEKGIEVASITAKASMEAEEEALRKIIFAPIPTFSFIGEGDKIERYEMPEKYTSLVEEAIEFRGFNRKLAGDMPVRSKILKIRDKLIQTGKRIEDFRKGKEKKINIEMQVIKNTIQDIRSLSESITNTFPEVFIPYDLLRELRGIQCEFQTLLRFPEKFKDSFDSELEKLRGIFKNNVCAIGIGLP